MGVDNRPDPGVGFPIRIDLLYLDGPHADREDGRQCHFDAYQACALNHHAVLLIDDTDLPRLGKAEFVVPAEIATACLIQAGVRHLPMAADGYFTPFSIRPV